MSDQRLGIEICGTRDQELDGKLASRLAARIASGDLSPATIRNVEQASFRAVPAGFELEEDAVERLRRLCQLWDVRIRPHDISSHRKLFGPLIVMAKKVLFKVLQLLLKDTLHQQRSFNAEVIRALAEMSTKTDSDKDRVKTV